MSRLYLTKVNVGRAAKGLQQSAERVATFGGDTPMKRPAQPEEIAPAFVFLAAPSCSSYITGEILPIIGGYAGG
jgi:NAD(P)-dependent dehydrogenase (short-subunit alcohol dehydrogenase family)